MPGTILSRMARGMREARGSFTRSWKIQKQPNATGKQKTKRPRGVCPKGPLGANRKKNSRSGAKVPKISADRTRRVRRRGYAAAAWASVKGTLPIMAYAGLKSWCWGFESTGSRGHGRRRRPGRSHFLPDQYALGLAQKHRAADETDGRDTDGVVEPRVDIAGGSAKTEADQG